jgi:hypothetical protein
MIFKIDIPDEQIFKAVEAAAKGEINSLNQMIEWKLKKFIQDEVNKKMPEKAIEIINREMADLPKLEQVVREVIKNKIRAKINTQVKKLEQL